MFVAFTTAVGISSQTKTSHKASTCSRRPIIASAGGGSSWQAAESYEAMGKGVQAKGMQQIEFIIRQDGRVEELVTGIKGTDCVKVRAPVF